MRIIEITNKPATPQQAKINSLKQQKERVSTQLKTEKDRQKQQKATQQIQKSNQVLARVSNNKTSI